MKRLSAVVSAVVVVCLIAGCAGGLLALLFQAVTVGALAGQVHDFLGHQSSDYNAYIDGYDLGIHPSTNGALDLTGLPTGTHLLSVVSSDSHTGFHTVVQVVENQSVSLGQINLFQGSVISGKVERDTGSGRVPLAGVRVAAVKGGGSLISQATGHQMTFPPTSGQDTVMTFTDAQGNYVLGPCSFGDWLVTTAQAGLFADAQLATVAGGSDATGKNLLLTTDTSLPTPGTTQGSVTQQNAGPLEEALVNALLTNDPFQPNMAPSRLPSLQSQVGGTLMAEPWFRWLSLAATTDVAGSYSLSLPPGTWDVYGFKFGYRAQTVNVVLASGQAQTVNFALPPR